MTLKQLLIKFGKEIKKARIDKDISQEALAEKAGMHVTFLSRIENGKANISLDSVLKLANALNIEVSELFKYK